MGASYQPQGVQAPGAASGCVLEVPYEAYTDSPDLDHAPRSAPEIIAAQVGPAGKWRAFAGWIPAFSPRQGNDDLPLLSENPSQRKKRACRVRYLQYLKYSLLVFFVML